MSFPYLAALSWRATMTEYASTKTFHTGQLGMTEDGSMWRLCKTGAALVDHYRAKINYYDLQDGLGGNAITPVLSTAIVAGDTHFHITDGTNTRAANYYRWGFAMQPRATGDNIRYIWKDDGEDPADVYTLYVTAPFTLADAEGNTIQVYPCPWGDVRQATARYSDAEHFVCVPAFGAVQSGYFFWGHVRGPHWMLFSAVHGGVWPGAESANRKVVFNSAGDVGMVDLFRTAPKSSQDAGYLMFSGTYGDALIYLQIE